jgi:ribosomal protein L40E
MTGRTEKSTTPAFERNPVTRHYRHMSSAPSTSHENRLARETSPYLLQHKHNPVDWWPWGTAALAQAKNNNKPILLSVGARSAPTSTRSTCRRCITWASTAAGR